VCRLYASRGPVDLCRALKLAARYDPYSPDPERRHGDGWGFAVVQGPRVFYYRSSIPAWEDPTCIPAGDVVLAHARDASEGEPVGVLHAHPYMVHADDGRTLFVAHNGSVDKRALAPLAGVGSPELHTDSFVLALFLARRWHAPERAIEEALKYVKSALNLVVLELPGARVHVHAYYKDSQNRKYYALYLARGGGAVAVMSSTLLRHIDADRFEIRELESGTYLVL
jgi:glutamine amidotransferase